MALSDRPTADLVLLVLTLLVAVSVLLTGAGIFVLALLHPTTDLTAAFQALASVVALMTGTVVGYLAGKGRSTSSMER